MSAIQDIFASMAAPALRSMHGESVVFYPKGDATKEEVVTGVMVARTNLTGSNQVWGEGFSKESDRGRRFRHPYTLDVPASVDVDETRSPPDKFRIFTPGEDTEELALYQAGDKSVGQIVTLKFIEGEDPSTKTCICVDARDVQLRRSNGRRG